jgi:proline iminopeptidase
MFKKGEIPAARRPARWTRRAALAAFCVGPALLVTRPRFAAAAPTRSGCIEDESSGYVEVPGGRVWWQRFSRGPGVGASRTPLLVLHGGPGAAHNYLLPLRALADERPVIFYDQLGCGLSDAPEAGTPLYRLSRCAAEIDAVRAGLDLGRVNIYAHSWGAAVALEYLISGRRTGVESLILGGATASVPQYAIGLKSLIEELPGDAGARLLALEASGRTRTSEYTQLLQIFSNRHVLRSAPSPEYDASADFQRRSPAHRVLYGADGLTVTGNIRNWDRRKDLDVIRVPTLITTGEHDAVTLDCHETLHRGIAGSKLRVLSGCSHFTMQEAPEAYGELIRAFLS